MHALRQCSPSLFKFGDFTINPYQAEEIQEPHIKIAHKVSHQQSSLIFISIIKSYLKPFIFHSIKGEFSSSMANICHIAPGDTLRSPDCHVRTVVR